MRPMPFPTSYSGCRTVVRGGVVYIELCRSSKPTIEMSSGTRMLRRYKASRAP